MTSTTALLQSIGYPDEAEFSPPAPSESPRLYDLAWQNKIASLYVKTIHDSIGIDSLEEEWTGRNSYQQNLQTTFANLGKTLGEEIKYAVVKTTYPFWVDAKDIDIVVFDDDVPKTIQRFQQHGYSSYESAGPDENVVDPETDQLIDIQDDFALQNIPYFDKSTIRDDVTRRDIYGVTLPVVTPPANLAVVAMHSLSEQLFILKEFYAAVFTLELFSEEEFDRFIELVQANHIETACAAFFTIVKELAESVFDRTPPYIDELLDIVGEADREAHHLHDTEFTMPHRYTTRTSVATVLTKFKHRPFRRGFVTQAPRLLRPDRLSRVLYHVYNRRTRDHYSVD